MVVPGTTMMSLFLTQSAEIMLRTKGGRLLLGGRIKPRAAIASFER